MTTIQAELAQIQAEVRLAYANSAEQCSKICQDAERKIAALQALTAASGTEREGVDLDAMRKPMEPCPCYDLKCRAESVGRIEGWNACLDALASRNLFAQPVPAQAEKDGGDSPAPRHAKPADKACAEGAQHPKGDDK